MMNKIVKTIAKIIFVITVLFGLYIILNGHLTPGGGFQGGAVIATGFALLFIAFGSETFYDKKNLFSIAESVGLLMFIIIATIGIKISFFNNFLAVPIKHGTNSGQLISAGVIPLMNIAVGLEVVAALTMIIILMSRAVSIRGNNE